MKPQVAGQFTPDTVFIGGMSRSGTTILARLVGAFPECVHVGELTFLWERGLTRNELCGCGQPFRECPFWSEVLEHAFGRGGPDDQETARVRAMRNRVENLWAFPLRSVGVNRRLILSYGEVVSRVLESIRQVSGKSVVIDSSKRPNHGLVLRAAGKERLAICHVVRDPRGVAFSSQRMRVRPEAAPGNPQPVMPRNSPVTIGNHWMVENIFCESLARGVHHARVRYEDLSRHPRDTLLDMGRRLGLHGPELPIEEGDSEHRIALIPEHSVSGNPARFGSGVTRIAPDNEWKTAISSADERAIVMRCAPLMKAYGYDVFRSRGT